MAGIITYTTTDMQDRVTLSPRKVTCSSRYPLLLREIIFLVSFHFQHPKHELPGPSLWITSRVEFSPQLVGVSEHIYMYIFYIFNANNTAVLSLSQMVPSQVVHKPAYTRVRHQLCGSNLRYCDINNTTGGEKPDIRWRMEHIGVRNPAAIDSAYNVRKMKLGAMRGCS